MLNDGNYNFSLNVHSVILNYIHKYILLHFGISVQYVRFTNNSLMKNICGITYLKKKTYLQ